MGGLINERRVHIMVSQVLPGSPSSLAGLSTGDELISVNGEKPDSIVGAVTALRLANAGTVQLEVVPGSGGQPTAAQLPVAVMVFQSADRRKQAAAASTCVIGGL
eukprot:CAMPEP_0181211940 /NCGR_PEP_ID=MMETSP1096-20121128/24070_1 /TAXON_ID=156174 ORGANISM="Chrysochromulina ericina, Strain CCMP281" /NCGR_SAMPLE_ID=MMETSP1096 /ASSEMBLY_ACC=CAM_ASM_000453 /LENGTH=104 /DNA_ID=CAMNT_0023303407 /DNA_START=32 /DNA_END=347 /DNA_ORIENTATION=+